MNRMTSRRTRLTYRLLSAFIAFTFSFTSVLPPACAQSIASLNLPVPGTMVTPSAAFVPVLLKGITIHPENPLQFDFIVDSGNTRLQDQALRKEASKLFKYFLAALTVPEEELWVNLSPYEKDRVIPQGFGDTEMGRDLLAQDYLLKQLTASLMYPEKELGKKFWDKVYKKAREQYGTTEIPMDTFNKVWIVPEKAVIYEQGASAFVVDAHLKVMLDSDYMAQKLDPRSPMLDPRASSSIKHPASSIETEIIREVILPEIEKEVNEGKTFANLRQIYNASILAAWYKMNLKTSLLGQVYADRNKTKGVDTQDKEANQKIYNQYLEAFKKGVYNYIKEDYDPATQEIIPRKYFSGGTNLKVTDKASILRRAANGALSLILAGSLTGVPAIDAEAMVAKGLRPNAAEAQAYQFAVNIVGLGPKADENYITTVSNGTLVKQIGTARGDTSTKQINRKKLSQEEEEHIIQLIALLSVDDPIVRSDAGWKLIEIGEPAVLYLIAALHIEKTRGMAMTVLAKIGEPAVQLLLPELLNRQIKRYVMTILQDIGEPAIPQLVQALKFSDINEDVAVVLYVIGKPAIPYLIESLNKRELFLGTMTVLRNIGTPAIPPLIEVLMKKDGTRNIAAGHVLVYMGDLAIPYLIKELRKELRDPKASIITVNKNLIIALDSTHSIPYLEKIIANKNEPQNLRNAARFILMIIKKEDIDPKLLNEILGIRDLKEVETYTATIKNAHEGAQLIGQNFQPAMEKIDQGTASSPIKIPKNLATKAIAAAIAALTLCTGAGCGPDRPSQTPPSQQQIDMSQQSIVQLRDYLKSTKWAEQRDAAIEIFKRYQASVTGVTISDVELARKLVIVPLIEKLTSPDSETINSESYKRLIELGEIAIKPLKDNLVRESADINTRQWSEQLLEEIIDDVLKQFDEILPSLSVVLKNPNSLLYDFAIERVEMLIRKQPLALQIPKALQLLTHATAGVRLAAANTLGDIGDESAVFGLEDAVRIEQDPQVKTAIENAIGAILKINEIQNWGDDQLKEALESPYWAVERTAIQVIFKRNNQENIVLASTEIQERINQLTSTSTNTRNSIPYLELLELGDIIKDSLKTTLNNENADINTRKWSADLLEQFAQFDEILLTYESILGNTESAIYISIGDRLKALIFKQPAPLNKALELIQYPASGIKIVAVKVLGDIGDLSAIPILESERKNNPDPNVTSAIEIALDKILTRSLTGEYEKDFVVLTDILKNPDFFLYTSAIDAFQKLILNQPAPLNKAIELLEHELVGVRVVAINVLGEAGNESVVPTLEFLRDNDPDPDIVASAKGAIGKIFANIVAAWSDAHLMEALDDISWYVQKAAALELLKRNHVEGIALAQNKLVWPKILKLTAESEEATVNDPAYQELIELGMYLPQTGTRGYTIITAPLKEHISNKRANYYTRQWSIKLLSEIFPVDSWVGIRMLENVSYYTYKTKDVRWFHQMPPLSNFIVKSVKDIIVNSPYPIKKASDLIGMNFFTPFIETGAIQYLGEFGDQSHIPLLESNRSTLDPYNHSIVLKETDMALDKLYKAEVMFGWSREQLISGLSDASWTIQKSAAREIYKRYQEGALPYEDVIRAQEKLVAPRITNISNRADPAQMYKDREELLYLDQIAVGPSLALFEEVIADSQNNFYQRKWDDGERRFILSFISRLNDPRIIDPILRYHAADGALSVTAAYALQGIWPESEKTVPILIEELKWGNIGATWLVQKSTYTKEALSAILYQLRNYGPHDYPGYMNNSDFANQYGHKRHFFRETDAETFEKLLLSASPEDRDILRIVYLTNQPDHGAVTDGYLYNLIQSKTIENEVAEIFNNSEVLNSLVALETMSPDVLKRDIPIVTRVEEGADLWANNSLGWLTQDMRTVALSQKSVVTKLLAQEGDLIIPIETTAHFSWSGDPDIIIRLPAVTWSTGDIPQLQELLSSEYEYFRIAAQKALDKINSGDLMVVSPSSSPVGEIKTEKSEVGGIDLNPALLDLQIKTDGNGVPLPLPQQPILEMKIEGFIPVIINVVPIPNLPMFLGFADTRQDENTGRNTTEKLKAREPEDLSLLN